MKTILEHGYNKYQVKCTKCNCVFNYELSDITDGAEVFCPDCGGRCFHFNTNYLLTSQIKDFDAHNTVVGKRLDEGLYD